MASSPSTEGLDGPVRDAQVWGPEFQAPLTVKGLVKAGLCEVCRALARPVTTFIMETQCSAVLIKMLSACSATLLCPHHPRPACCSFLVIPVPPTAAQLSPCAKQPYRETAWCVLTKITRGRSPFPTMSTGVSQGSPSPLES